MGRDLVKVEDVKRDMGELAAIIKSGLLNIPDRLAAELAGMTDQYEIHATLTREINDAISELNRTPELSRCARQNTNPDQATKRSRLE